MVRYVRFPNLSVRSTVTTLGVALALALVSAPIVGSAQGPSGGDPSSERERVRAQAANVATQVDALQATDAQVEAALVALERNVAGQQALLAEAKRAAVEAEQAFADATAAVELKTAEIAGLRDQIREFAVDAFVHPPSDDALAALDSDDPGEAAEKRALLEIQNASDADLLDQLRSAEEDLEVQRQLAEAASQRAEEKQAAAGDRLAELTEARDLQSAYAEQVEARLEHSLSEAAALAELDADLSAEIRAEQARAAELARRAAAVGAPAARRRWWRRRRRLGQRRRLAQPLPRQRVLPGRRLDHRGQLDRRLAPVDAQRGVLVRDQPVRRRLPVLRRSDPDPHEQLRHELLRHLRDAGLAVQPADGPSRPVDARAGPRHRLHVQRRRRDRLPQQPLLPVAGRQRQRLRVLQPPQRTLALVQQRQLGFELGGLRPPRSSGAPLGAPERLRSGPAEPAPRGWGAPPEALPPSPPPTPAVAEDGGGVAEELLDVALVLVGGLAAAHHAADAQGLDEVGDRPG